MAYFYGRIHIHFYAKILVKVSQTAAELLPVIDFLYGGWILTLNFDLETSTSEKLIVKFGSGVEHLCQIPRKSDFYFFEKLQRA